MDLLQWIKNEKIKFFLTIIIKRIKESEISNYSLVVAYYLLFSLFPLLIAIGNLLPFLHIDVNTVLPYISEVIPKDVYLVLEGTIRDLLSNGSSGLLSISAIVTLWSASKSINAIQMAMNKAYGVESRNSILSRLVSFGIVFLLLFSVIVAVGFFGLGQVLLDYLEPLVSLPNIVIDSFDALKWPATFLVLLLAMALIYFLVPNAKVRFRSVLPGAIFTTVGWMFLSQFFGIYAHFSAGKFSSYGIIGSFILLMLWLNWAASIIILGGVINAAIEELTTGKGIEMRKSRVQSILKHRKKKEEQE